LPFAPIVEPLGVGRAPLLKRDLFLVGLRRFSGENRVIETAIAAFDEAVHDPVFQLPEPCQRKAGECRVDLVVVRQTRGGPLLSGPAPQHQGRPNDLVPVKRSKLRGHQPFGVQHEAVEVGAVDMRLDERGRQIVAPRYTPGETSPNADEPASIQMLVVPTGPLRDLATMISPLNWALLKAISASGLPLMNSGLCLM
jgi:hypothetical protein